MIAIDLNHDVVLSGGTAYYRLPKDFKEFLKKCEESNGILGFEFVPDSWNFGVILKKERE